MSAAADIETLRGDGFTLDQSTGRYQLKRFGVDMGPVRYVDSDGAAHSGDFGPISGTWATELGLAVTFVTALLSAESTAVQLGNTVFGATGSAYFAANSNTVLYK